MSRTNILIPSNEFLQGYFQPIVPCVRKSGAEMTDEMGILKVKEGVKLLMFAMPALRNFLFDFSEPYKINLEKFMLHNFHFNVPVEKFAQLTSRSLAAFKRDFLKTFGAPSRHCLQDKRLNEAKHLIEPNIKSHLPFTSIWVLKACRTFPILSRKSSVRCLPS